MTYLDTALETSVSRRLERIKPIEIVIGLPAYKNSRTIGDVMRTLGEGIVTHYPDRRALIFVSDGGSTDDTLEIAQSVPLPDGVTRVATEYLGVTGKGSAIRAIMEAAELVEAEVCAVVDADVRSITPEWVERLVGPVVEADADFVSPLYTRDRHEVTINDLIVFPMTRMLYGRDVRHPLGGEIAMRPRAWRTFLARDVWETDVARFGIHVWMITLAINAGWQLYQAPLGTKTHDYKDPTVGFEPKFLQIVGTLFRLMTIYRRTWPEIKGVHEVPTWREAEHRDPEPVPTTRQTLWEGFRKGIKRYRRNLNAILDPEQQQLLSTLMDEDEPPFDIEDWARMVMDFAVVYNRGEGDPDKVALALLPIYYARKATLLRKLKDEPFTAVEQAVQVQAARFLDHKPYLIERWESYLPWQTPTR